MIVCTGQIFKYQFIAIPFILLLIKSINARRFHPAGADGTAQKVTATDPGKSGTTWLNTRLDVSGLKATSSKFKFMGKSATCCPEAVSKKRSELAHCTRS